MILTITMNPSVDISYPLEHLELDDVNRVKNVSKTAGGKGLNVSRVLHQLKADVLATGVVGGYLGGFIKEQLDYDGIEHDFTAIQSESRNSIAILHDNGHQTEILEAGPVITKSEEDTFLNHYQKLLEKATTVTISGSMTKGCSKSLYAQLIALATQKSIPVLLDTSGEPLEHVLQAEQKPFLIKPNEKEIADLIGEEADSNQLLKQLKQPIFEGVEWVVVSLGAKGAIVKHQDCIYQVGIPTIKVINPVGSGDATLAGLAAAIDANKTVEDTLKLAMTTGMLNALEEKTGCINPDNLEEYFNQVTVTQLV